MRFNTGVCGAVPLRRGKAPTYGFVATVTVFMMMMTAVVGAFSMSMTKTTIGKEGGVLQLPNIFVIPPIVQRFDLKRKIIQAAKAKDEGLILSLVEELAKVNPTPIPTLGLQGYKTSTTRGGGVGSAAPLNGKWKLLYTNARDAEAPARTEKNQKEEPFGDAVASGVQVQTGQRITAETGECINFIQLNSKGTKQQDNELDNKNPSKGRPFDRLDITIQMTPLSDNRVRLDFLRGRVQNPNAPLSIFRDVQFQFPPPTFGDFLARIRGKNPSIEPQAYFDVLYIDQELRAHRTGEGKIFIQQRDD